MRIFQELGEIGDLMRGFGFIGGVGSLRGMTWRAEARRLGVWCARLWDESGKTNPNEANQSQRICPSSRDFGRETGLAGVRSHVGSFRTKPMDWSRGAWGNQLSSWRLAGHRYFLYLAAWRASYWASASSTFSSISCLTGMSSLMISARTSIWDCIASTRTTMSGGY